MADSVRITDEAAIKIVEKYAAEKDIPSTEAAARLINTAKGRLNAVRKYAAAHPAKPKAKKPAKPKAEKKARKPRAKKEPADPRQTEIPVTEQPAQ